LGSPVDKFQENAAIEFPQLDQLELPLELARAVEKLPVIQTSSSAAFWYPSDSARFRSGIIAPQPLVAALDQVVPASLPEQ
jgi:hypothetical protein